MEKIHRFELSMADMEKLFLPEGFFHSSRQPLLSEGGTYYAARSKDQVSFLIIEVVGKKESTLGSLPWKEEYFFTNP